MLHRVTATLQGHPWDLWGLSLLFNGTDTSKTLVKATKPDGRPTFDVRDPAQVNRFRINGYDVFAELTCDELVLTDSTDLRDLRPTADLVITRMNGLAKTFDPSFIPVRLTHLSYPTETGAGALTAGDWTPNKDSTRRLSASLHRELAVDFLKLANVSPAVTFVLEGMTLSTTWASLYLVFDAISADVGGQHKLKAKGWLTDDQISDLTNTANNTRSISEGARHGNRPNPQRPFIPLDVAQVLTSHLVVNWLYSLQGK